MTCLSLSSQHVDNPTELGEMHYHGRHISDGGRKIDDRVTAVPST